MSTTGQRLRELRGKAGLSLRKAAVHVDIDVAILSKMERGKRKLSKEMIIKLTDLYNVKPDDLIVNFLSEKVIYELKDEELGLEALKVAESIQYAEVKGQTNCHNTAGASRETGCFQFLDSTWRMFAKDILGYVPPRTYENERYVVVMKIEKWLRAGYTPGDIALIGNGGEPRVKSGINQHGVAYDTGIYRTKVLAYLNTL